MFNNMLTCVKTTVKICTEGKLADSTVEGIVRQNGYSESTMCSGGSLEVPTVPAALVGSLPCSSSFSADANNCLPRQIIRFAREYARPGSDVVSQLSCRVHFS